MNDASPQMLSIFGDALECKSVEGRAAYLDRVCKNDDFLRARVEALLKANEEAGRFLQGDSGVGSDPFATKEETIRERPGTVIGPYKLIEQIGEGGMGLVFVAEQQHPLRRKVALKVIKPGMDTRQVIARFEAERQALALMDHPNISRVLDGGETASGLPYFVMDLVKGVPITEYCDQHQLTPRERLELFSHVCSAVQHAHQKGIIHRDIKPSNVLVMSHDGTPMVKVIDFGVAKAVGQQLTDKSVYTQFAQLIGTPLYMSPEQAGQSGLDVDTRTDIYALGVLLYELLTGTTPFDKDRLREADYDEIRRIIREEEPPKPSTRISTLGLAASTVSTQRKSDPRKLSVLFRGELDWIVMKALEKDRNRRYETASAFAADVGRYLKDEAVQACPPSRSYRLRKWLRKHRAAAGTGVALALVLVLTSLGLAVNNLMVRREQDRTQAANERLQDNLALSLKTLDEIYLQVLEDRMGRDSAAAIENQELLTKALGFYEQFAERNQDDQKVRREVAGAYDRAGVLHTRLGHYDQAIAALSRAEDIAARLGADLGDKPELIGFLAEVHLHKGQLANDAPLRTKEARQGEAAQKEYRKGIELLETLIEKGDLGLNFSHTLANLHSSLASIAQHGGDLMEGEKQYRKAIGVQKTVVDMEDNLPKKLFAMQQLAASHANLGNILGGGEGAGRLDVARDELQMAIKLLNRIDTQAAILSGYLRGRLPGFPNGQPVQMDLARAYWNLGANLRFKGYYKPAEDAFRQAVDYSTQVITNWPMEPLFRRRLASIRRDFGILLLEQGKRSEALQECRESVDLLVELDKQFPGVPDNQEELTESLDPLAEVLFTRGDHEKAAEYFRQFVDLKERLVASRPDDATHCGCLAWFYAVCVDPRFRNPGRAVVLADKADKQFPENGWYCGVLGVAHYRNGQWKQAVACLEKANQLRPYRYEGFLFYLAMAHWRLGEREAARACFDRAAELMKVREYPAHVAGRAYDEARQLLSIPERTPAKVRSP